MSIIVPSKDILFIEGNNYMMLPKGWDGYTASELGEDIGGSEVSAISYWDSGWQACVNYGGAFWSPDDTLTEGMIINININAANNFVWTNTKQ